MREFGRDQLGSLTALGREYGDIVSARFGRRSIVFVNHPDLVEEVLVNQNRKFIKHYRLRERARTLGQGLLTSEGEFWRSQRKLAQPAFHRDRIAAYGRFMVEATERMLGSWTDGQVRDVQEEMMRLTLEIVAKTLFDAEIGGRVGRGQRGDGDADACLHRPDWQPDPRAALVSDPVESPRERAVVGWKRSSWRSSPSGARRGEDRGDLLSMLLHAQDEESGRRMTDQQLRDEVMTLFMAGHETTANTLAWTWFLLSQHPEVEARLHAELDQVLDGRSPTVADLPR